MIIYCDESGGKDDDVFLVSAVPDFPNGTDRPVRNIRNLLGISGELKGHALSHSQLDRALKAFALADRCAQVAVLRKLDPVHRRIMAERDDAQMWEELIFQSVFLAHHSTESLTVIIDGGRYTTDKVREVCNRLAQRFCNQLGINQVNVEPGESHHFSGLQLADISSNKAYRSIKQFYPEHQIMPNFGFSIEHKDVIVIPRLLFERIQPPYT